MTVSRFSVVIAASMLFAAPAFAQSAGTSATGTSNGATGTPGQGGPTTDGSMGKEDGSMAKSGAMKKGGGGPTPDVPGAAKTPTGSTSGSAPQ